MYTAVRIVKMNACRNDTSTSKPVSAISRSQRERQDDDQDATGSTSEADDDGELVSSRWPASMLAKSRTDSDSGRTMMIVTSSIGDTRM